MADMTFNTPAGQVVDRKLLILYLTANFQLLTSNYQLLTTNFHYLHAYY